MRISDWSSDVCSSDLSANLLTILAKSGFDSVAGDLLRADTLPFSFTQKTGDALRASADLNEAIAVLAAGRCGAVGRREYPEAWHGQRTDRKSTRLNSSH